MRTIKIEDINEETLSRMSGPIGVIVDGRLVPAYIIDDSEYLIPTSEAFKMPALNWGDIKAEILVNKESK